MLGGEGFAELANAVQKPLIRDMGAVELAKNERSRIRVHVAVPSSTPRNFDSNTRHSVDGPPNR